MATKILLNASGLSSLRSFLRSEISSLRQSPVLIVASEPAATHPNHLSVVAQSCQVVNFVLAQELGLRTVQSNVSSAFPTTADLDQRLELLRRTGASSVVAVGSGAAMDLSKALPFQKDLDHVILVPSTSAATMAASSTHSLFLDSVEETLVPFPRAVQESNCRTTVALLESSYIAPAESTHLLYASLALILDACYRKSSNPRLPEIVQGTLSLLENTGEVLSHEKSMELLSNAGQLASYGLDQEDRSTPIALASSLIPTIFPHVHALTFFASLLPGICELLDTPEFETVSQLVTRVKNIKPETIPQIMVSDKTLDGFSIPDMSLSHIRSNQTVWKSFDVPDQILVGILERSIKR
eukprot:scaffold3084_cov144-Cylindrotheca_fusiformis.AAC.6